jgi:hypothetical protein
MKQPSEADFEVKDDGSQIVVTFKPTKSDYTFGRLDPSEWRERGEVSASPKIRHAKTGDTG